MNKILISLLKKSVSQN